MRTRRLSSAEIDRRVHEVAEILSIVDLLPRRIQNLSGGQKQRVGIGRAIVREPRLFIMDEPISHLDARLRADMRTELKRLHRRLGVTTLYVTHDQLEAVALADRIAVMHLGVLQQVGAPAELFDEPVNEFVAGFIGSPPMNMLSFASATLEGQDLVLQGAGPAVRIPAIGPRLESAPAGGAHKLGIRPVDVLLRPPEGDVTLGGEVLLRERLGRSRPLPDRLRRRERGGRDASPGRRRHGRHGRPALPARARASLRERQRPQAVRARLGRPRRLTPLGVRSMADVVTQSLSRRFGKTVAVDGIDLACGDGDLLILLGPSGAGKTTTLKLIAGLVEPTGGRVLIGGRDVTGLEPGERDIAMAFETYALYPHLSVYDNLAFPLRSPRAARRYPPTAA